MNDILNINRINTQIFIKEYETRGSHPSLFECSDGNQYVVKHSQQGRNYKHLINEFIAVQIAQLVNAPVPDFAIVDIDSSIFPKDFIFEQGLPSGLGFGSKFVSKPVKNIVYIDTIIKMVKAKQKKIVEDLISICALDIFLRNNDRSVNNPNLLIEESGAYFGLIAIDHSSIFCELNYNSLHSEINEIPPVGDTLVDKELFNVLSFEYGLFFNQVKTTVCKSIADISDLKIIEIVNSIPKEWKISAAEKESIINFIQHRKKIVENHYNLLLEEIGL